ncbi:MAG: hypothetical protein AUG51_00700 [Acidobacteria bacterium 13_1_20CM_3_53_8]|nr:MAG: hypothetical protein AUG51_00700 [Acidobacteria bacterium 13_1_20CM_3_53_8]
MTIRDFLKVDNFPEVELEDFHLRHNKGTSIALNDVVVHPSYFNEVLIFISAKPGNFLIPKLHEAMASGQHLGKATLKQKEVVGSKGLYRERASYEFTNILATSFRYDGHLEDGTPRYQVTFEFASMSSRYF